MKGAYDAYHLIARTHPEEAAYVVPLAFGQRVTFTWNIRELFHFIELRSAPQGHISYRRVAQAVYFALKDRVPLLARYIRVTLDEAQLGRLEAEERTEAQREALAARGVTAKGNL